MEKYLNWLFKLLPVLRALNHELNHPILSQTCPYMTRTVVCLLST